jgi:hypothetical protein
MKRKIENEAQPYQTHAGNHRRSCFFGDPILHEVRACSAQSRTCFLVVFADLHAGTSVCICLGFKRSCGKYKAAGGLVLAFIFPFILFILINPLWMPSSMSTCKQIRSGAMVGMSVWTRRAMT